MHRRTFVKQTGAAALAVTTTGSSGPFVHAGDKSGAKTPIVGKGEHRYECHHNWGEVPASIHWFETHGVAIDNDGFIYIKHRAGGEKPKTPADAQDSIVVFDPAGKFVRSFGKEYHGGGHGIDIRKENGQEFLYLSCMFPVNLVVKTDLKGEVVWIKQAPAEPHVYDKPNTPFSPTNVAFAPDGGFYVGDGYGSHYIHQFDKDARWVRTWGGEGVGPGKLKTPHGRWLDNRPGRACSRCQRWGCTKGCKLVAISRSVLDNRHAAWFHERAEPGCASREAAEGFPLRVPATIWKSQNDSGSSWNHFKGNC